MSSVSAVCLLSVFAQVLSAVDDVSTAASVIRRHGGKVDQISSKQPGLSRRMMEPAFDEVSATESCPCGGTFRHHDLVQVVPDTMETSLLGLQELPSGPGRVIAGAHGPSSALVLLVEFPGWAGGHGGECHFADCDVFPRCVDDGSSRWWFRCSEIQMLEKSAHRLAIPWPSTGGSPQGHHVMVVNHEGHSADMGANQHSSHQRVACTLHDWQDWAGDCSVSCGGGTVERYRLVAGDCSGTSQENLVQAKSCNTEPCGCHWGAWSEWDAAFCSVTCGGGTKVRTREKAGACSSDEQGLTESQQRSCGEIPCPINCVWADWREWGSGGTCSASCGGGVQTRTRFFRPAYFAGLPCDGNSSETRVCNDQPCPVDCELGDWADWQDGMCSASCGGGLMRRTRPVLHENFGGHTCAGNAEEARPCNEQACPVDCQWTPWSTWSHCSTSCGEGLSRRTRHPQVQASHGGQPCTHASIEELVCNGHLPCPVDCQWGIWSEWAENGACSATCGGGWQSRERAVEIPDQNGGATCQGESIASRECNTQPCPTPAPPVVPCAWQDWSAWSLCSQSCGGGVTYRTRGFISQDLDAAMHCISNGEPNTQDTTCNTQQCPPVDCVWSDWAEWGHCAASCGVGLTARSRSIAVQAAWGGSECHGNDTAIKVCDAGDCDCRWTDWSSWTDCMAEEDRCVAYRQRLVLEQEAVGSENGDIDAAQTFPVGREPAPGECMGPSVEQKVCPNASCGGICTEWTEWTEWSLCSATLGGIRLRERAPTGVDADHNCTGQYVQTSDCDGDTSPGVSDDTYGFGGPSAQDTMADSKQNSENGAAAHRSLLLPFLVLPGLLAVA
mmetsp:Transcript_10485/g.18949  ORF Transcript_10485/g.18949 Transcript_10485/m.18949 type:complete len:841 (+) Transcript_10485:111-2633(+)